MRKEDFAVGEYYHVYNRGVDKRLVFLDTRDYRRFVNTLYILNNFVAIPHRFDMQTLAPSDFLKPLDRPLVSIGAMCLMPNHYHLLVTSRREAGISRLLHKVGVSYTMYFNKRYERSGSLFESVFKAKYVDTNEYVSYLTEYIHLNPKDLFQTKSRTELLDAIGHYEWSSLPDYLGHKSHTSLLLDSRFRDEVLGLTVEQYGVVLRDTFALV